MSSAGPVRVTSPSGLFHSTLCAPPGARTSSGERIFFAAIVATAAAQAPVRTETQSPPFCDTQYAATQRVPFPEISASDPSALNNRARTSASLFWSGKSHSTPSAPIPLWRSQMRRVKAAMSEGVWMPSTIRKSLPHAEALVNGITVADSIPLPVPLARADKLHRFHRLQSAKFL